ncbi:MAG: beta strand repeat-containing protein [Crocosphaera sp.]
MANSFVNLSNLDGNNGFVLNRINIDDPSRLSVSNAGDVNGDGIDDVIIGADSADTNGKSNAGASYVVFGSRNDFAATIDLNSLDGVNGFVINGSNSGDHSGTSVSGAGDINGDGIDDLIIGANGANPNGQIYAGESYVVFGSDNGFEANLELGNLDGSNGFVINGAKSFDFSGSSVSGAGDVNGDGVDDLVIGAFWADPNGNAFAGESYVVFGSRDSFGSSLELSNLDGQNGFVIEGMDSYDFLGSSVSNAGDVNGDGFDDLIVGGIYADPNGNMNAGESYVIFGSGNGFDASFDLNNLDGSNGFIINGIDSDDKSGCFVSSAGDVNGDGFDDLIVGAIYADPNGNMNAGESYVVFGSGNGFEASLELSNLDGSNGFVINGIDSEDKSGNSVSSAGDVNGDGIDDLIIGTKLGDPNGNTDAGESYVIFGSRNGFSASFDLSSLDGSNGYTINGINADDQAGSSVSGGGDINGDGIDDLIIASGLNGGETYVVFGEGNNTITISSTNLVPTGITGISLDNATIAENSFNDTLVGTLTTTDANLEDTHIYTLLDDAEGRFKIVGEQLQVADGSLLDFEANTSHIIEVQTTDNNGLSFTEQLTINLSNVDPFAIQVNDTFESNLLGSYDVSQDTEQAVVNYSNNELEVQLVNNAWKDFDLGNYNITADTVLSFEFRSDEQGEIHGIGFDNDNNGFNSDTALFQLYGTQTWNDSEQSFNNYNAGDGWKLYTIDVGTFVTGNYDRLVLFNDNDTSNNLGSSSYFRNIVISEDTLTETTSNNELMVTVGENTISQVLESYGNDSTAIQDTPEAVVTYHDNGNEVQLDNNGWKSLDITNYNVTENTRLRFEFRSEDEGELHGIGLDNDDDLFNNSDTKFQLYGTQTFANQAVNDYQGLNDAQAVDGWKEYDISLGQYFTGDYDRLVFFTDNDTPNNLGGSSQFRNIVIEEVI